MGPIEAAAFRLPGLDVLVCEDEWLIRSNTVEMLRDAGHRPVEAMTAGQALEALGTQKFDVLLTDIGLPDMSGVDLALEAKRLAPWLGIIFASGYSEADKRSDVPGALRIGKPYQISDIERALERLRAG